MIYIVLKSILIEGKVNEYKQQAAKLIAIFPF